MFASIIIDMTITHKHCMGSRTHAAEALSVYDTGTEKIVHAPL